MIRKWPFYMGKLERATENYNCEREMLRETRDRKRKKGSLERVVLHFLLVLLAISLIELHVLLQKTFECSFLSCLFSNCVHLLLSMHNFTCAVWYRWTVPLFYDFRSVTKLSTFSTRKATFWLLLVYLLSYFIGSIHVSRFINFLLT